MVHGVSGFFLERRRANARVSALSAALAAAAYAVLIGPTLFPPLQRQLNRLLPDPVRFGYEGPDQYVRRIELIRSAGTAERLQQIGKVEPVAGRRGGQERTPGRPDPGGIPRVRSGAVGPGASNMDFVTRAVSRLANVPVVQSEDLVIERLVRPEYPNALLERDVEGRVTVQALVDTVGRVVDVQVMASSGELLFERAAEAAVWQCRFRPYRRAGAPSEVYAVFRFSFRIYD
jgi:TonB family protein